MEVDDQREVIGGHPGEARANDPGLTDGDPTADKGLVERSERQPGREGAEKRDGAGDLPESRPGHPAGVERVPPVVEVADDHRRMGRGRAEQRVPEEMLHLPMPLALREPQVGVNNVEGALGGIDEEELGPARLAGAVAQGDPMTARDRPAREDKVAIRPATDMDVGLKDRMAAEPAGQQPRLIVTTTAADESIDFLKADKVGILSLDTIDDPLEDVPPVAAADPLVDVPGEESHVIRRRRGA